MGTDGKTDRQCSKQQCSDQCSGSPTCETNAVAVRGVGVMLGTSWRWAIVDSGQRRVPGPDNGNAALASTATEADCWGHWAGYE